MVKEKIDQLIEASASNLGYWIYESSVYLKGENSKVTVKIDKAEGISHNDCEVYSRELSRMIDEEGVLKNYSIEVSSPGFKRKVRGIEEFERFTGSPVKIICEIDGERGAIKGKIKSVEGDTILIISENKEIKISCENIISANLDF